jgi:hypothetical protein
MEYQNITHLMEVSLQDRMARGFDKNQDNIPVDNKIEPERPKILTPDKRLILPAQPKREKPQGFTPNGPMRVDQFPNRIRNPYGVGGRQGLRGLNMEHDDEFLKERGIDRTKLKDSDLFGANSLDSEWRNTDRIKKLQSALENNEDSKMEKFKRSAFEEMFDYFDDERESTMKEWLDETEGMNIKEMLEHDNFAFKHYVMGNEISDFLRHGDTRWRTSGEVPLDKLRYGYFWSNFADVISDGANETPDKGYRGLRWDAKDAFKDLKQGQIVSDPGFMSTATDTNTPESFGPDNGGIMMHLNNKGARGAIDMDYWGDNDQSEMVFPPNTALQYEGNDDKDYYFNILSPDFNDIDKYGKPIGYDRKDYESLGFMESKKPLKLLNKMKDKFREAFQQRMNDFQFQVLTPETEEEKPQPKQFRDVLKKMFDFDD